MEKIQIIDVFFNINKVMDIKNMDIVDVIKTMMAAENRFNRIIYKKPKIIKNAQ